MTFSSDDFLDNIDVSRETFTKLEAYANLLTKWQPSKNLVSNSTIGDMWCRHFYDSAQLYALIRKSHGDKALSCVDIGSGAGFPGLVLSIMGIGSVAMVESNGKKCSFMRQVVLATGADAKIANVRIEELEPEPVDIILSRACASVSQILEWCEPFVDKSVDNNVEYWLLKGASVEDELKEASAHWTMRVDRFKSKSDGSGTVLRLRDIHRR